MLVGFAAGSSTDISARLLAPDLERELGVPVQIVNRPGAGTQIAMTELVRANPDGYTLGYNPLINISTAYLDPSRGAIFTMDDFHPLGMHIVDPNGIAVAVDSPYRDMTDFVEAARANPGQIRLADFGIGGGGHLASLALERVTGADFTLVHFDGGAPAITALLGGHVDAYSGSVGAMIPFVRNNQLRVLGILDDEESQFLPDVRTLPDQGIDLTITSGRPLLMPAGGSPEVIEVLTEAIERVVTSEEHGRAIIETGQEVRYMDPEATMAYWRDLEAEIAPLVELARQEK
jgi:tripartite-type tricarboxylate transporter receptor subunit TctC